MYTVVYGIILLNVRYCVGVVPVRDEVRNRAPVARPMRAGACSLYHRIKHIALEIGANAQKNRGKCLQNRGSVRVLLAVMPPLPFGLLPPASAHLTTSLLMAERNLRLASDVVAVVVFSQQAECNKNTISCYTL